MIEQCRSSLYREDVAVDQEIADRFRHVIDKGNALRTSHRVKPRSGHERVESQPRLEWQSQSQALLDTVFRPDHAYTKKFEAVTVVQGVPQTVDWHSPSGVWRAVNVAASISLSGTNLSRLAQGR